MSRFPPELFGQIAQSLSTRDLWSLSLVSTATVDEANRLLYRNVDFSSLPLNIFVRDPQRKRDQDKPINSFLRAVANSHRLASFVRAFAFRTPYQPDPDVDASQAMRALINVGKLSVTSILSSDQFPSFLHDCSLNLKELHMEFPLDSDLLRFVKARPGVQVLSCGREKLPSTVPFTGGLELLPALTDLSVIEGTFHLAEHCPSVTHLNIRISEQQSVDAVFGVLKVIGSQLLSLTLHQSLFYGSEAIVQCLGLLAELTPNLKSLEVMEHFCGGWGNEPCTQYVSSVESLDLAGSWSMLESITWTSHLSCHDHLVYWDGAPLCKRAFSTLPSLVRVKYSEDGRGDSDSSSTFCYERNDCGDFECNSDSAAPLK